MNHESAVAMVVLIITARFAFMMLEILRYNKIGLGEWFLIIFSVPMFFLGLAIPYQVFFK